MLPSSCCGNTLNGNCLREKPEIWTQVRGILSGDRSRAAVVNNYTSKINKITLPGNRNVTNIPFLYLMRNFSGIGNLDRQAR